VYVGSQYVHVTENGGQSWKVISPDLTLNDKKHEQSSGGVHGDNLMTFEGEVLYSIAESPVQAGVIWTGSTDGQVNITRDDGKTWVNVTKHIPNLPPWGTIWNIEPSHFDPGTAYVVDNLEQGAGDYNAYVYKTTDYGATWKFISGGIPKSVNSSAHCIVEDPERKGMLYLGTDNFIYVSWDDGDNWTLLRNNMPPAPIYWMTIQRNYKDLVVATYGRGFWILDDLTPLREYDKAKQTSVTFFKPRDTYRYRTINNTHLADTYNHIVGENPPHGADLNYYLGSEAKDVKLTVLDESGKTVREIPGTKSKGVNRVWWDLRCDAPVLVKLRNSPPGEPWVEVGKEGWRPVVHWRNYTHGPLVAPGSYTVRLDVDGQQTTQPLVVLRDPKDLGSEADIKANTDFMLQLVGEMNTSAGIINHYEDLRKQINDVRDQHRGDASYTALIASGDKLDTKLKAVEELFFPLALTGRIEDAFRVPTVLYGDLTNLAFLVEGGADLPPTDQSVEMNRILQEQLDVAKRRAAELDQKDIPAYVDSLKTKGIKVSQLQ
jgi:photosystem II stability/assembly factor-like uncharacterized protein